MIKSYQYFVESLENADVQLIFKLLKRDCQPFLNLLKECKDDYFGQEMLFWRGIDLYGEDRNKPYKLCKHKSNRLPKDTPDELHEEFNELFYDKFGWYARSGAFATRNKRTAGVYGIGYMFFPVGKVEYVWSTKIDDFFTTIREMEYAYYTSYDDYEQHMTYQWDQYYGNPTSYNRSEGQFVYKDGTETGKDSLKFAIREIQFKINETDPNSVDINPKDFTWKPKVPVEEFIKSEEIFYQERNDEIKEIMDNYTNDRICFTGKNEVSFNCEEYYLVDDRYMLDLITLIWGNEEEEYLDPNQLKLEFPQ